MPERGGNGPVCLRKAELRQVDLSCRFRLRELSWVRVRGEKVDKRGEVVIAVGEYSDVVLVMLLFFGDGEIELLRGSGEDKVLARAEEGRWRREVAA